MSLFFFFKECPALTNGVRQGLGSICPAIVLCLLPVIAIGTLLLYKMAFVKQSKFRVIIYSLFLINQNVL